MHNTQIHNAADAALGTYVSAFVASKRRSLLATLHGAHETVIATAQANIAVLMVGRVLRDSRRTGRHPMEMDTTQCHEIFDVVASDYVHQLRNDLAREGRQKVLGAALHRGTQDFHGGRVERTVAEAHDALRAEVRFGSHTMDAVLCSCAQLVSETALLYVDATIRGRQVFPDTLVADALQRIRVTEGKVAKPDRTANVFISAAEAAGVNLPSFALPVMTDLMYHLSGWDARLSEGAFFARLADRHLGDRKRWSEVAQTIAEVFAAARAANPQSRSTLEKNVDRVWADRFGEPLDLDAAAAGDDNAENDRSEMGDGTEMAA